MRPDEHDHYVERLQGDCEPVGALGGTTPHRVGPHLSQVCAPAQCAAITLLSWRALRIMRFAQVFILLLFDLRELPSRARAFNNCVCVCSMHQRPSHTHTLHKTTTHAHTTYNVNRGISIHHTLHSASAHTQTHLMGSTDYLISSVCGGGGARAHVVRSQRARALFMFSSFSIFFVCVCRTRCRLPHNAYVYSIYSTVLVWRTSSTTSCAACRARAPCTRE